MAPEMPERRIAVCASAPDAAEISEILVAAGFDHALVEPPALLQGIRGGGLAAAILHEEVIDLYCREELRQAVADQPHWSDFPFILLTDRSAAASHAPLVDDLGNVALVERPLDGVILIKAARSALRSRARQQEAQTYFKPGEAEEGLRRLAMTLEARVRARTKELRTANERLLREIDERHAAEQQLRESEELYRYTVELSRQLVWTADSTGRITSLSPRFGELTGLEPGTDPHEGWLTVVHPDDYSGLMETWAATIESLRPNTAEFRMRLADGSYRTFLARAAPRLDEHGNVIRWYGFTEDVEDRKRAEAAQREAEERYRLAAKATDDAIWDLDLASNKIRWSESAADSLGYPGRRLGTTSLAWWEDRVHPEDYRQAVETLDEAIRKGKARWTATYRFRKADGSYGTFFDRGFITRNAQGETVRAVGAMTDITERERATEEVRRIQAELIHVSRLSAMGTMASTLAHELNQPLTAVTNYVRGSRRLLVKTDEERLDQVAEALERAENGALRAGQIVRRLRELVARGTAAVRPEELPKLIEEAGVLAFIDAHLLGVTRRIELDPGALWVEVDRIQIQQVLINLIRNALQAMENSKRREVAIESRRISDHHVELSVSDTGSGISDEVRETLFSPFQGTKADGLGIGLSISRTIIEAHGGKIWAEDREGGGTVFRLTLPLGEPLPAGE